MALSVPTAFGSWPPLLCRAQSRRCATLAFTVYKRSTPPCEQPFSSSVPSPPLRRRAAVKRCPGPPPNLLTPPRALHRHRELPRPPCRRPWLLLRSTTVAPCRSVCATVEPPAPVSPPLSSAAKPVRHPTGLLSATPPPPTGRLDFTDKSPVPTGENASPASALGRKAPWARPGRPWPNGLGPFQQYPFLLFRINSIQI
jgi:hypothetical protein